MTQKPPLLDRDIHIRLDSSTQELIAAVAKENCLKESTLCRVILQRELPQYTRNRLFA